LRWEGKGKKTTYFVYIVDDTVDDLSLEGFEYDSTVACDKLGLATSTEDHPLSDVEDRDNSDDVSELTRTCSFYVCV
jgi:hypothetical protein